MKKTWPEGFEVHEARASGITGKERIRRARADFLSLRYHLALESLQAGVGGAPIAQALLEMTLGTVMLAEAGFEVLDNASASKSISVVRRLVTAGRAHGIWHPDQEAVSVLRRTVCVHDSQLQTVPLDILEAVFAAIRHLAN
ncbi:hypothetical protein [Paraburkholderia fynbosensis]|uniref:Fis family transcriptional regulator n=1 Tax=Paraburkholderia fynbosensis TaxID=1200993 RepID=A0A6J5H8R2_9BURK|nr:hypothetical protein [Paraburkholderia fynbosensis]CAB3810775.1 hypothetical protein LMG27177_07457 [Paraburkholderia fynbosensis]